MMKLTFSVRCIQVFNLAISSSECHSSCAIGTGVLLCHIASIWCRMINTSCIISFHRTKFLSSNFRISTLVSDAEAMFYRKWDFSDLVLSFSWFFSSQVCVVIVVGLQVALMPNVECGWCGSVSEANNANSDYRYALCIGFKIMRENSCTERESDAQQEIILH